MIKNKSIAEVKFNLKVFSLLRLPNNLFVFSLIFVLGYCMSGCDSGSNQSMSASSENSEQENISDVEESTSASTSIPWFEGSIEQAFAEAQTTQQPLFLYWGAIWCPPCEQMKQTVFKHPAFLAQTQSFVSVYLDGDTDRAQTWGDQFSVAGYPTMILFSPEGEELTRIPGGIDTQQYIEVFQAALNDLRGASEILQLALNSPDQLTASAFNQLAFYSWEQSDLYENMSMEPNGFRQLSDNAQARGNDIASSRLYLHYLNQIILDEDKSATDFGMTQQEEAQKILVDILSNKNKVLANIDYMVFYAQDFIPLVTDAGSQRRMLTEAWVKAMEDIRYSKVISSAEQLATWYPQLYMYWINDPEATALPELVKESVVLHINEMDKKTVGDARQTVVNKSYQVLKAARLYEESRNVLLQEIEKSHAPYYFMSGLASLEEEQENRDEAVHWLKRAYDDSKGSATRFQWGVEYIEGITRMTPEAEEEIISVGTGLINELDQPQDIFSGRNFGRLNKLLMALKHWQSTTSEQPVIEAFYNKLVGLCSAVEPGTLASENCSTLTM